jgi:hypothetical protein
MDFLIAASFTDALARLPAQDQKAVKTSAFDMQVDPAHPGLQLHRIDKSKDANFWSARVSRDIRIIVHKTEASLLLAYVDHHDKAYAWAERRRIEAHPKTGAIQIVEVRERVEEIAPGLSFDEPEQPKPKATVAAKIFAKLRREDLLGVGVPEDWIADVQAATEDGFLDLYPHLPAEAAEALLEFAATGRLPKPAVEKPADPFLHPDAKRRFRVVENLAELQAALDYPWDKWTVFLHPSQRALVERDFSGPARVAGSAGTGKTVVALHRAVRLAQGADARVLLTTFSDPLARALDAKVRILSVPDPSVVPKIVVASWEAVAIELFQLAYGTKPHLASDAQITAALAKAFENSGIGDFTPRFIRSEWTHVVDAWQVADAKGYRDVPRLGRRNRLGSKQRDRLWPLFEAARESVETKGIFTPARIMAEVARHYGPQAEKPFTHIVVDEAQDLGAPELRLLTAISPVGQNRLFLAGDLGQRIFQQPFSWKRLGVDVRGRSTTLKVNYRTSHQIRGAADRLLPTVIRDVDGLADERKGTVSVFEGPEPLIALYQDEEAEIEAATKFLRALVAEGAGPGEIGVFVRDAARLPRARRAVEAAGLDFVEVSGQSASDGSRVSIGAMHFAKGLEFKAVVVMACDQDALPLRERVQAAGDEVELEDVYEGERQLLYVACTRARDRLFITGVAPGSEFLADLQP